MNLCLNTREIIRDTATLLQKETSKTIELTVRSSVILKIRQVNLIIRRAQSLLEANTVDSIVRNLSLSRDGSFNLSAGTGQEADPSSSSEIIRILDRYLFKIIMRMDFINDPSIKYKAYSDFEANGSG